MSTVNINDAVDRILFLIGDPDKCTIDPNIIDNIASEILDANPEYTQCQVTYDALIASLRYIINSQRADSTNTSGSVKSRRERRGISEIEVQYSDSGSAAGYGGWDDMLEEYLADPTLVCKDLVSEVGTGFVIIGGVDQAEYDAVVANTNNRNPYQTSVSRRYNFNTFSRTGNRNNNFSRWRR